MPQTIHPVLGTQRELTNSQLGKLANEFATFSSGPAFAVTSGALKHHPQHSLPTVRPSRPPIFTFFLKLNVLWFVGSTSFSAPKPGHVNHGALGHRSHRP